MSSTKLIFVMVLCLASHAVGQLTTYESTMNTIESLYNSGQYLSAEVEARRTLELSDLADSVKIQLEKMIAFSLIAQGKPAAAKDRFVSILNMDGTFELDPIFTSPKILSVFNDARVKFVSQKKNMVNDSLRKPTVMQTNQASISFRTMLFPGWEQLHQQRETTGYILLSAGAVTLSSGIIFEYLRANARDKYLKAVTVGEISSKYDSYNTYRKAEIYSFSAFAIIFLISEIDVFSHTNINLQPSYSSENGTKFLLTVNF